MDALVAEFLGTALLVFLGNGVVANVVLAQTKGHGSGWIVICVGWGCAVYLAAMCAAPYSGAHLNPAVTVGLAFAEKFAWDRVPAYLLAQLAGGVLGGILVYGFYRSHFQQTSDPDSKLAAFCTAPAIRSRGENLFCEILATMVLVFVILAATAPTLEFAVPAELSAQVGMGAFGPLPVGLLVLAIGLCLGGTTGYAINPARDLGPRLAHWILPVPGKRDSDWGYAWVPVVGPLLGGVLAALLFGILGG